MRQYTLISRRHAWFALVWALTVFPGIGAPAYGAQCLDDSPTVRAGKDPYAAIDARDLTQTEYHRIKSLFESLAGEWQGTATEFFCMDIKDPADKKTEQYTLKARVQVDYFGNFLLNVELYSPREHVTHPELMRFYLDEKRLRINTRSDAGDVQLLAVEDQKIQFLYRLLLPGDDGKGTIHKEFFVLLSTGDNAFSIRQRIYSQGRLSSEQEWNFTR